MQVLPLVPGVASYRVATTIGDVGYVFDVAWNGRDQAWYFDAYEDDGTTAIFHGVKIVLGANLGRIHRHRLVTDGALVAIDTSRQQRDAGFADLGTRVIVVHIPALEIAAQGQRLAARA